MSYWEDKKTYAEFIKQSDLNRPCKAILGALNRCKHSKTGLCYPGTAWLVQQTGYASRTIKKHKSWLKQYGYIKCKARWKSNGERDTDLYELCYPQVGAYGAPTLGAPNTPPSAPQRPYLVHTTHPNISLDKKEHGVNASSEDAQKLGVLVDKATAKFMK
jgi:hypothetical protein